MLDPVLDDARAAAAPVRVRALVLRAGIAATLDDGPLAQTLLTEATATPLTDDERAVLADHLARAAELADHFETSGA